MAQVVRSIRGALAAAIIAACAFSGTTPAAARDIADAPSFVRWRSFIAEASHRFGIPETWIRAVMQAESSGVPRATSPKGAMGLMQIMPDTWAGLCARYRLDADPYDPRANILAGTAYLRELYERYGYPNLFAAYNTGPRRFDEHLLHGRPLPTETLAYLARLDQPVFDTPRTTLAAPGNGLFFPLHATVGTTQNSSSQPSSRRLFVPLNILPEAVQSSNSYPPRVPGRHSR
ncbi:MAG: lytic transglycosylase domain-containing protein [Alphaproteobacteria bacterium]|nr:lytic transglycosylase domain-containing protein [Alphaproteobacteria bacterium]